MKLYEIAGEFRELEFMLEESGGEITPDIEIRCEVLKQQFNDKMKNVVYLLREWEHEQTALEAEARRFRDKAHAVENRIKNFRNYVARCVPDEKGKGEGYSYYLKKSESIEVPDESKVPETFWKQEVKKTVSKTLIKEALEAGQDCPFATKKVNTTIIIR